MNNLDNKIDEIIEQAAGIKPVKANPYLYSKVMTKMESNENSNAGFVLRITGMWVGIASVMLLLNVMCIYKTVKLKHISTHKISSTSYFKIAKENQMSSYLNIQ